MINVVDDASRLPMGFVAFPYISCTYPSTLAADVVSIGSLIMLLHLCLLRRTLMNLPISDAGVAREECGIVSC